MSDRYEKIRQALEMGPTPGPWGLTELPRDMQRDGYKFSISRGGLGWWIAKVTHEANGGSGVANATYITACDPDTIRELLAERDQLAAALEAAQRGLRYAVRVWVLSDEIAWSEEKIDEAVERIIGDAKNEARND